MPQQNNNKQAGLKDSESSLILETLGLFTEKFSSAPRIWIAYSGGVDSHVLLHAVYRACQALNILDKLHVVYIHHGLHPDADDWEAHCADVCNMLGLRFLSYIIEIEEKPRKSLEEIARQARYQALKDLIQANDLLLTAHHQDDQAETCFLQFLRGSGPKGLAAMPSVVSFGKGFLLRPFLSITREAVLNYAHAHSLKWIEDDSNHNTKFTRNFLRYRIMPLLRERWPSVSKTLMRVASHCAESDQLLKELAEIDLAHIKQGDCLLIDGLKKLSYSRQKNVLRFWLHEKNFPLPSTAKLKHILSDVIGSRIDNLACVAWRDVEVRKDNNQLYAFNKLAHHDPSKIIAWDGEIFLKLPIGLEKLHFSFPYDSFLKLQYKSVEVLIPYNDEKITVRFRQGGEICRLPKRQGARTLKKVFKELEIPYWLRDRVPLIYFGDQLVMIINCFSESNAIFHPCLLLNNSV